MIRGNKYLRRVFYLVARNLEPFNGYYERLIARGKSATQESVQNANNSINIM